MAYMRRLDASQRDGLKKGLLMNSSIREIHLNVRGLPPPEPMEQVLDALATLKDDQALRVEIDREPFPLYGILTEKGFRYSAEMIAAHHFQIRIWQVR